MSLEGKDTRSLAFSGWFVVISDFGFSGLLPLVTYDSNVRSYRLHVQLALAKSATRSRTRVNEVEFRHVRGSDIGLRAASSKQVGAIAIIEHHVLLVISVSLVTAQKAETADISCRLAAHQ